MAGTETKRGGSETEMRIRGLFAGLHSLKLQNKVSNARVLGENSKELHVGPRTQTILEQIERKKA